LNLERMMIVLGLFVGLCVVAGKVKGCKACVVLRGGGDM
jgi:hypothetical protein